MEPYLENFPRHLILYTHDDSNLENFFRHLIFLTNNFPDPKKFLRHQISVIVFATWKIFFGTTFFILLF